MMKLDLQPPVGRIGSEAGSRYFLLWEFKGARGKCELRW